MFTQASSSKRQASQMDTSQEWDRDELLKRLSMLTLQAAQKHRMVDAILLCTWKISAKASLATSMRRIGDEYHKKTKGKKGHTEGLPAWHLWGAMVKDLSEIEVDAEKLPEVHKARQVVHAQMVSLTKPEMVADIIEVCTAKPCFDKEWVMIRYRIKEERSDQHRLLGQAVDIMMRAAGALKQEGQAPASHNEREVQKALDQMSK